MRYIFYYRWSISSPGKSVYLLWKTSFWVCGFRAWQPSSKWHVLWLFSALQWLSSRYLVLSGAFVYTKIGILIIFLADSINFKIRKDFLFSCYHIIGIFFYLCTWTIYAFATSCGSKPFAFCIKEQHIIIVVTDWSMITTFCVCDPQKRQTGSMTWDWYITMARCHLDAMRKYARRRLSGMSFSYI